MIQWRNLIPLSTLFSSFRTFLLLFLSFYPESFCCFLLLVFPRCCSCCPAFLSFFLVVVLLLSLLFFFFSSFFLLLLVLLLLVLFLSLTCPYLAATHTRLATAYASATLIFPLQTVAGRRSSATKEKLPSFVIQGCATRSSAAATTTNATIQPH